MFKKLSGAAPQVQAAPFDPRWWNQPTLATTGTQDVVGEASYQDALRWAHDQFGRPQLAQLVREPRNKYDRNAVAVLLGGQTVGYLPREVAPRWHAVLDQLGGWGTARAVVTGGWSEGYSFGCVLLAAAKPFDPAEGFLGGSKKVSLSTPKALLAEVLPAVPVGGAFATATVADDGTVWLFADQQALGKFTKAQSETWARFVGTCAATGVAPTCRVTIEEKPDGSPKLVTRLAALNDDWLWVEAP